MFNKFKSFPVRSNFSTDFKTYKSLDNKTRLNYLKRLSNQINDKNKLETFLSNTGAKNALDFCEALRRDLRNEKSLKGFDQIIQDHLKDYFTKYPFKVETMDKVRHAATLQNLIGRDKVHELNSLDEIHQRITNNRRIAMIHHDQVSTNPLAFVQIYLASEIIDSVHKIFPVNSDETKSKAPSTAIFYSINSDVVGFQGLDIGQRLLDEAMNLLAKEFPSLHTFSTLSPIPNFTKWSTTLIKDHFNDSPHASQLARYVDYYSGCRQKGKDLIDKLQQLNATLERDQPLGLESIEHVMDFMEYLCYRFITERRESGRLVEPVARFHLKNGAQIYRINPMANRFDYGIRQSLSFMVNYRYYPKHYTRLRDSFMKDESISISPNLIKHYKKSAGEKIRQENLD